MLIRSGDICGQSQKLLQITLNFGRLFTLQNSVGGTPCKISVNVITPAMSHIPW